MVDRRYHDYATSALRELMRDLTSSRTQLEDERADYAKRADVELEDLHRLDVLVRDLDAELAAIDKELVVRRRDRPTVTETARPGVMWHAGRVRPHTQRVMRVTPKPHCRAKRLPSTVRGRH